MDSGNTGESAAASGAGKVGEDMDGANTDKNTDKTKHLKKPWKKGQSGNPNGRPKVAQEFRERCREFMESDGWDELIKLAQKDNKDKRAALELIAAYAYGKPKQGIELETGDFNVNVNIKGV